MHRSPHVMDTVDDVIRHVEVVGGIVEVHPNLQTEFEVCHNRE